MTSVQEFSCVFCKESFDDKESLQIHFRKHGDPKFDQTAKAKVRSQNDSPMPTEASKDDNEMVSCDVCSETFPTISKAITHKHKVHPDHDAKYFCPWCGKLFTLKHLYNKHLQSSHDSSTTEITDSFHCDCCDVDFFIPSAMVYHNKFFHRQDAELPSIGHSKKVKLLNQELVQIYYCPFCGEEYNNKVNLHKHMMDDHNDENQSPEDVLRCPLCEAVLYHLDAYELHLTFHSSDDLYSEENELLKQITEFSLDTVPPLMEKVAVPAVSDGTEDLNALSIDQFLQLSMNKDTEEELPEHTEKIKVKKHKKHKKSKKTITLDEFLNMNADVFGEDLNFQGIEEVPTRIVKKQLKSKKEQNIKNSDKNLMSSSDIDKLKKQGITIKMKSGKKPLKVNEFPSMSSTNTTKPIKSNAISTSSEVLSKLMSQGNGQIKIMKKAAVTPLNLEQSVNEKSIVSSKVFDEQVNQNEIDNKSTFSENESNENAENQIAECSVDIQKDLKECCRVSSAGDTLSKEITKEPVILKECSQSHNTQNEGNLEIRNIEDGEEYNTIVDNSNEETVPKFNHNTLCNAENTLSDFEENLATSKIMKANIPDNVNIESQLITDNMNNIPNDGFASTSQIVSNNTLDAIKHLSHLITVKSINQSKSQTRKEDESEDNTHQHQCEDFQNSSDKFKLDADIEEKTTVINKSENENESTCNKLEALKNISKQVTIKSVVSQVASPKNITEKCSGESEDEEHNRNYEESKNADTALTKNIIGKKVVNFKNQSKPGASTTNLPMRSAKQETMNKNIITKTSGYESPSRVIDESNKKTTVNADLLKRLTNVTAKTIPGKQHIKQEHAVQMHSKNETVIKQECTDNEIEIYNIDDSDSDGQEKQDVYCRETTAKSSPTSIQNASSSNNAKSNSYQALQNLSKNITIKASQSSINPIISKGDESITDHNATFTDDEEKNEKSENKIEKTMNQHMNQTNKNLQSALKNLGRHLTVKSSKLSPNFPLKMRRENNEKLYEDDTGSDSDSNIGRVKIKEITQNVSDNEFLSDEYETKHEGNVFVQSPSVNSEMEDNSAEEDNDNQISNVENQTHQVEVKNKLEKPYQSSTVLQNDEGQKSQLSNFRRFNKEITIKSLKDNKSSKDMETEVENTNKDSFDIPNNINKEVLVKQLKPNIPKHTNKLENHTFTNQGSFNEKLGTTSNQINTINKEVSVKTFQSQTVIEEITTTVTKTIRTVNQTVKQEVKNTSQINVNKIKPQKIINYNQQVKNLQNTAVRHASPSIGTKIKNAATAVKPSTSAAIRPSNQLVPVRPGLHLSKPCNPTIPIIKNITPSKPPTQKPITSRALKISPQAMKQVIKRSSDEMTGQSSCFKKPKESFPMEVPTFKSDQDGEAIMQFSSSQSRSDITSTVRNVKGKSVVTSTQTKSEMSTSSHLSKLGNVSGLKIMKTSSKQATQVEERTEDCGTKRTMEALQKLQMQGLLVKRPRTECNEDNEFSHSGSDEDETFEK